MRTDEQLMREYQNGSEEAFGLLYEKYSSMVYGFIQKKIRPSEVEDLYQKVWRRLHEARGTFRDQPFAPWFFVMIRNLIIDEYRSQGRRNERFVKEEIVERLYSPQEESEVDELLEKLPPDSRELVKKYYLEGITYEELESETGLSQTNLRQRLSRAVRSLRKIYEE